MRSNILWKTKATSVFPNPFARPQFPSNKFLWKGYPAINACSLIKILKCFSPFPSKLSTALLSVKRKIFSKTAACWPLWLWKILIYKESFCGIFSLLVYVYMKQLKNQFVDTKPAELIYSCSSKHLFKTIRCIFVAFLTSNSYEKQTMKVVFIGSSEEEKNHIGERGFSACSI